MQKKFYFAHLKSTFSILHTYFYKTPTSVCLLYTFIQIKYSFFNTVNNNCERKKKGKESEVKRRERKKELKKSFTRWTVTVYIYTVTVHLQDYCAYLDIFTKTDVRGFWVKMCKIEHFLYFNRLSISWYGCSNCFKDSSCFSLFRRIQESQHIYASVTLLW